MKGLKILVMMFLVAWRWKIVRFVTGLQEKADSTLTSGQKWPKKSEKFDMNPFYVHKESTSVNIKNFLALRVYTMPKLSKKVHDTSMQFMEKACKDI